MRVADNNRALPMDRLIFEMQQFDAAFAAEANYFAFRPNRRTSALHQYTIGLERTLPEGDSSIDIRFPFTSQSEHGNQDIGVEGGRVGNLNIKFKTLLAYTEETAISAGLGIDLPTGSEVRLMVFNVHNSSTFLQPFLATEHRQDD